jgi:hypothetical protein
MSAHPTGGQTVKIGTATARKAGGSDAVTAGMGVAGGELLIPTIVLLHGVDIKIAGSLSLVISLPTMLVAFARYSRTAASSCSATTPSL